MMFHTIHLAAAQGDNDTVVTLIKDGISHSKLASGRATPLHFAAVNRHPEVCATLIRAGADTYAKDEDELTAFEALAQSDGIGAVNGLIADTAAILGHPVPGYPLPGTRRRGED